MKLNEYLLVIEEFLEKYLKDTGAQKYVLGLSGGVDSSLVAAIIRKRLGKDKLTCLLMPIDSNPDDLKDGLEVAKALDLDYLVIDGSKAYHASLNAFEEQGVSLDIATKSNLKVRTRMSYLYAYAQAHKGLVVGTDNWDERYTGYFTKYGDGAADILPIVHLLKSEVVEAAKMYGVPANLANRVPSAGLFEGQTDEKEMGVKYSDLDKFLLGKEVSEEVKSRIMHLHKVSEHKRKDIPSPSPFDRDER